VESNIKCSACKAEQKTKLTSKGLARLPRGWKRHNGRVLCQKCWSERYLLRAITMRVAKPVNATWAEFREALKQAWSDQTRLVNWMVDELYARDVRREPGQDKLQKMPNVYLYPEARARFPGIASQTVATTEQQVKLKWRAKRYEVLWLNSEHLPRTKYPAPLPIPAVSWSVEISDDDRRDIIVTATIAGRKWKLRLVGGWRYKKQRAAIEAISRGDAVKCELAIYRRRAGGPDRSGKNGQQSSRQIVERDAGGQRARYDVACKIVAWLPRKETKERSGTLHVKTDSESLIVALNEKDERLWIEHADHIKRIRDAIEHHTKRLHRLSDDAKAEQRPVPKFASRRIALVQKQHQRMKSWISEIVAHLVGYADRRKFAAIEYDDSDRRFVHSFPWDALRIGIEQKCDEVGIVFQKKHLENKES